MSKNPKEAKSLKSNWDTLSILSSSSSLSSPTQLCLEFDKLLDALISCWSLESNAAREVMAGLGEGKKEDVVVEDTEEAEEEEGTPEAEEHEVLFSSDWLAGVGTGASGGGGSEATIFFHV